jgi:hypothetical protein
MILQNQKRYAIINADELQNTSLLIPNSKKGGISK